jgi:hypothetical protein
VSLRLPIHLNFVLTNAPTSSRGNGLDFDNHIVGQLRCLPGRVRSAEMSAKRDKPGCMSWKASGSAEATLCECTCQTELNESWHLFVYFIHGRKVIHVFQVNVDLRLPSVYAMGCKNAQIDLDDLLPGRSCGCERDMESN